MVCNKIESLTNISAVADIEVHDTGFYITIDNNHAEQFERLYDRTLFSHVWDRVHEILDKHVDKPKKKEVSKV